MAATSELAPVGVDEIATSSLSRMRHTGSEALPAICHKPCVKCSRAGSRSRVGPRSLPRSSHIGTAGDEPARNSSARRQNMYSSVCVFPAPALPMIATRGWSIWLSSKQSASVTRPSGKIRHRAWAASGLLPSLKSNLVMYPTCSRSVLKASLSAAKFRLMSPEPVTRQFTTPRSRLGALGRSYNA